MTIINEQIAIVKHYMENMNEYRLDNGEWWENLKKLKLKDKSETYINQVDELKAKKEAEIKAENERKEAEEKARKEAEKLAKAPVKKQLRMKLTNLVILLQFVELLKEQQKRINFILQILKSRNLMNKKLKRLMLMA